MPRSLMVMWLHSSCGVQTLIVGTVQDEAFDFVDDTEEPIVQREQPWHQLKNQKQPNRPSLYLPDSPSL